MALNDKKLSLHLRKFNDLVKVMNQSNSKDLVLTAQDARNIHSDLFNLLALVAELSKPTTPTQEIVDFEVDGGEF